MKIGPFDLGFSIFTSSKKSNLFIFCNKRKTNKQTQELDYLEDRLVGSDRSTGETEGGVLLPQLLRRLFTALRERRRLSQELSLRLSERSKMPSFCIVARFSLILSSLDCSYADMASPPPGVPAVARLGFLRAGIVRAQTFSLSLYLSGVSEKSNGRVLGRFVE